MKKHTKLALTFVSIFVAVTLISLIFSDRLSYEIVQYGSMEKSDSFEAMLIRDETVVEAMKQYGAVY